MIGRQLGGLLVIAAAALLLAAQPAGGGPERADGPTLVRLYVRDREHLNAVAGELDIWEVHPDAGYALAAVTPGQMAWLVELGYPLEVSEGRTETASVAAPLDPRFYTFDAQTLNPQGRYVVDLLRRVEGCYPHLTELLDIGTAWQGKRDLLVLRVTNEDPAFGPIEAKPAFFLLATTHAREVATPELALRYILYLTEGYGGAGGYEADPEVTWLVDRHVAYVLVMQNPDGHAVNVVDTSALRRKNVNDTLCPEGWFGVDLNRNASFMWDCCMGSSGNPCYETYRGTHAGSEPETVALEAFLRTVFTDQNGPNGDDELPPAAPVEASGILISLHSYGDMTLWPWAFSGHGHAPNHAQLATIGHKLAFHTRYATFDIGYDADGTVPDWTYGKLGVASFTFEVGPSSGACGGFFPAYECLDGAPGYGRDFWAENRPALVYAHKIALAPYAISYGPDAVAVTVKPATSPGGTAVEVTATLVDQRLVDDSPSPIAAAEYFIDAPGADGSGASMVAADGAWGGLSEEVRAGLETGGLEAGRYLVLVHGRSEGGAWGPFSAAFLSVEPGEHALEVSVVGEGEVALEPQRERYVHGQVVTLTAVPETGWTFAGWAGDAETSCNPLVLVMNADRAVTATFELSLERRLFLPLVTMESGPGAGTLCASDSVTCTAIRQPLRRERCR